MALSEGVGDVIICLANRGNGQRIRMLLVRVRLWFGWKGQSAKQLAGFGDYSSVSDAKRIGLLSL